MDSLPRPFSALEWRLHSIRRMMENIFDQYVIPAPVTIATQRPQPHITYLDTETTGMHPPYGPAMKRQYLHRAVEQNQAALERLADR